MKPEEKFSYCATVTAVLTAGVATWVAILTVLIRWVS